MTSKDMAFTCQIFALASDPNPDITINGFLTLQSFKDARYVSCIKRIDWLPILNSKMLRTVIVT